MAAAARTPIVHWFADRGLFDQAYDIESLALHRLHRENATLPQDSPLQNQDLIVSFVAGPDNTFTQNLERCVAAHVLAVDPARKPTPGGSIRHITAQWLNDLRTAELYLHRIDEERPLLPPNADRDRSSSLQQVRVICHPGSGSRDKCAALDDLERILSQLETRRFDVSWMIGPTERDWYGQAYVDRLARTAPVFEEHDVGAAADQLTQADVFIGNDAGTTHLAAAIGLRVVALFGPTDPGIWRPLGPRVHVIRFDQLSRLSPAAIEQVMSVVIG